MIEAELYIDYVSPYAYLAWTRAKRLLPDVRIVPRPVLLGVLLDHFGQLGPAEIGPKRAFTIRDTLRRAAEAGVPLVWPERHPFNTLLATRATVAADEAVRARVIDALYAAAWGRGENLEDATVVHAALAGAGLDADALLEAARTKVVSDALRAANAAAMERGVFGVPTFVVDGELFFGDDQLPWIARRLAGTDPLDRAAAEVVTARPMGVVRKRDGGQAKVASAGGPPPLVDLDGARGREVLDIYLKAEHVRAMGVRVLRLAPGVAEVALDVRPDHRQQDGFVHAGVMATIADHNAGAAAATLAPAGHGVLSIEFKINMLRPALGPRLWCRSTVLRGGRRVSVVESEVWNEGEGERVLVSKATVTLAVVEPRAAAK